MSQERGRTFETPSPQYSFFRVVACSRYTVAVWVSVSCQSKKHQTSFLLMKVQLCLEPLLFSPASRDVVGLNTSRGHIPLYRPTLAKYGYQTIPWHYFLSRYFPPASSSDPSATLRPKNSCSSSLLYGKPSTISILSIMAICCNAIVGELFVNMP